MVTVLNALAAWYRLGVWAHAPGKRQHLVSILKVLGRVLMAILVFVFPVGLVVFTLWWEATV